MFNNSGRVVKVPHGATANSIIRMQKPNQQGSPGNRPSPATAASGPTDLNRMPTNTVETFQIVKWIAGPATGSHEIPELLAANEETYRPVIRPAVPILTVLDDGAVDEGEQIRIRKDSFVIGRSSGDLTIPNDATMSGRHAEIRLTTSRGQRQWTLHNLESVNGTFVRVGSATLADDTIIILGSRRFRIEKPTTPEPEPPEEGTFRIDQEADSEQLWPILTESSGKPNCLRFSLQTPHVTIGRRGGGCHIQLDDPLVAAVHAELVADGSGTWKLIGKTTRNGVWVNTPATALASCCFFQCGEQRFKFVIP